MTRYKLDVKRSPFSKTNWWIWNLPDRPLGPGWLFLERPLPFMNGLGATYFEKPMRIPRFAMKWGGWIHFPLGMPAFAKFGYERNPDGSSWLFLWTDEDLSAREIEQIKASDLVFSDPKGD